MELLRVTDYLSRRLSEVDIPSIVSMEMWMRLRIQNDNKDEGEDNNEKENGIEMMNQTKNMYNCFCFFIVKNGFLIN
ncbi:hypothetical protein Hanom_Chr02g00100531 [Helianthus anomalus]